MLLYKTYLLTYLKAQYFTGSNTKHQAICTDKFIIRVNLHVVEVFILIILKTTIKRKLMFMNRQTQI